MRGKAREYSAAFELAWREYGRKEQKYEAYGIWILRARELGGEAKLLPLILAALKWQAPLFSSDGWKYAPYFERYLKRRKWEDQPAAPVTNPDRAREAQQTTRTLDATEAQIARLREAQARQATPEEVARAREESRKLIADLAQRKAMP